MTFLPILLVFGLVYLLLRRNQQVLRFLNKLTTDVYMAGNADMEAGVDPFWRLSELTKVNQTAMVFQFWRPLTPEEWWSDTSFLRQEDTCDES
jgi:hypothetical protein